MRLILENIITISSFFLRVSSEVITHWILTDYIADGTPSMTMTVPSCPSAGTLTRAMSATVSMDSRERQRTARAMVRINFYIIRNQFLPC